MDCALPAVERGFEEWLEFFEFVPVIRQKAFEISRILSTNAADFALHSLDIRTGQHLTASAKNESVLRVQPPQIQFAPKIIAKTLEDTFQHLRIMKEGGTMVEAKTVLLKARGTASYVTQPLQYGNAHSGLCQKRRCR